MNLKKNIRKVIFLSLWAVAGAGAIVLLVAAVSVRSAETCKGYDIDINGVESGTWFIDRNDIINVLTDNRRSGIKGKKITAFNLDLLETRLENEVWIRDAELFFDNAGILHIKVKEREPIARIFTPSGSSFYIDSTGQRLPLSDKLSARVPVFTGYPIEAKKNRSAADKKLIAHVKELSLYLLKDPFWMAQISQIDITPTREFEMIPTLGNHIIEFGDGSAHAEKFHRLQVFYRQVLSKAGMDKYERIRVQYSKQIVAVKKEKNN